MRTLLITITLALATTYIQAQNPKPLPIPKSAETSIAKPKASKPAIARSTTNTKVTANKIESLTLHEALINCKATDIAYFVNVDNVNKKFNDGQLPLHKAILNECKIEVIKLLIQRGADINGKNDEGETPLHLVGGKGRTDLARLLIGNGANVNEINNYGSTPLWYAQVSGTKSDRTEIIELFKDNGAH